MAKSGFGGKASFRFDRKKVERQVGKTMAAALLRAGAYTQRAVKSSMKNAPKKKGAAKHSRPGESPFTRTGGLKNSLRFAWDERERGVVVGPIAFRGRTKGAGTLEESGTVSFSYKVVDPPKNKGRKLSDPEKQRFMQSPGFHRWLDDRKKRTRTVTVPVRIEARPYMRPGLEKTIKQLRRFIEEAASPVTKKSK